MVCVCVAILQMPHRYSYGKEPLINLTSSPVSKRTRQSLANFDNKRFKTFLDSQTFNNNFKNATTVVERIVRFDTLGSTFIPKILVDRDWAIACLVVLKILLRSWSRNFTLAFGLSELN